LALACFLASFRANSPTFDRHEGPRGAAQRGRTTSMLGGAALPWGTTRLAHFAEGRDSSEAAVFINLDEDLEGDSEFNPIPISE
jgi:hypothetical protein